MIKLTNFDFKERRKKENYNGQTVKGKQRSRLSILCICNDYDDLRMMHQGWITMDMKLISSKFDLFVFEVWFIYVSL